MSLTFFSIPSFKTISPICEIIFILGGRMILSSSSLNGNNAPPSQEKFDIIQINLFDFGNHSNLEPTFSTAKEKGSPRQEKQIGVDPISLQQEPAFFGSKPLPPIKTNGWHGLLPPLSSAKSKFLSHSLPSSATTSPRFPSISNLLKRNKKWVQQESQAHTPPQLDFDHLMMLSPYLAMQQEMRRFRRSKSCGEGRAIPPSVDFDLLATQAKAKATGTTSSTSDSSCTSDSSESECHQDVNLKNNFPITVSNEDRDGKREKESRQEEFKCGALCLFLPGFGKAKPVKSKKDLSQAAENNYVISRTVSLEKFECGSWASPIINVNEISHEDGAGAGTGDSANLYFDLPLEMIQSGANDMHSPVTAAFIFDKERKGVLKNGSMRAPNRKSHESSRHVRFSTSSPTSHPESPTSCITPRLRKAREDFNAFLEAQSA
ncbi:uncharacterized protein LOC115686380 [Syzygium oleosum]|uniref:uncharacterized protein LOC115686380 n=1 Tax=Syzygium oleosum TaxID=219896 RepID=UPI0011D185B7|nr:uncharacterized protein LOC115686380 [Syzygium oleosum]